MRKERYGHLAGGLLALVLMLVSGMMPAIGMAQSLPADFVSIQAIQETTDPDGDSPYLGEEVTTQGIVTGVFNNGYFIEETSGGPWSGLWVYDLGHTPAVGDELQLTGTVDEYYNLTELLNLSAYEVVSTGNPLPGPQILATGSVSQEQWEGVFVRVENVTVTNPDAGFGEWVVSDGSGDVMVDNIGTYNYDPADGELLDFLQGPLNYSYGDFKIAPRSDDDIAVYVPPPPEVQISEIRIDQPGGDDDEYFELIGAAEASLAGLTYVVIGDGSGGSGVVENVTGLGGESIGSSGYFVAAESSFTLGGVDLTTSLNFENGDNVTHLLVSGFTGANGDDLDADDDGTLDVMPWDEVLDCVGLVETTDSGDALYCDTQVGPDGYYVPSHVYLCDEGWRIGEYGTGITDSPGTDNPCDIVFTGACGDPATFISAVQGDGLATPLAGTQVVIEGIVVGDFQWGGTDDGDLGGFYVQEENDEWDSNPETSEGIFVYDGSYGTDVSAGDRVRVNGFASEYDEQTQIGSVQDVIVCGDGYSVTRTDVSLPVTSVDDLEAYEGMAVRMGQELVISEFYNFDRYGEIVLTLERQFQPTAVYEPGSTEAYNLAEANRLSRITLEDGRTDQNPDPALHPNGMAFTLDNRFRGGDIVQNVVGAMSDSDEGYEIQPTAGADYTAVNERPDLPDIGGNLEVAAFNVLNYFTTFGSRGADNQEEFDRQRAKIIAALESIDADVVGLIEIENNTEAIADLVNGLNASMGAGTYEYVDTGVIGSDAIKVAFIYKPAAVSPVGDYAVLDDPAFVNPNTPDPKNRPALAQTFMDNETGGIFTAVINHLKSKGSPCGPGDDDPQTGSCNLTRALAAQVLADWLATDPTGSGDADYLILGDLNAYDKEDPIDVLKANGYTDLLWQYVGEKAYSYVFDGQLGYLDYGMPNADLLPEVTGVTAWHINADEPDILDYDTSFKEPAQAALFEENPFRSSDHDPVIVGLDVCDEIPPTLEVTLSPDMLWPPNHQYVTVNPTLIVSDNFDPNPMVTLISVISNEPDNGLGDGDMPNDIVINPDGTVDLRAERSGTGDGRIYTFTYQAADACGNTTEATATVTVPFSQGQGKGRP